MDRFIEALESRTLLSASPVHKNKTQTAKALGAPLTAAEVQTVLAQAISQALPTQAAVVVDREGQILGMLAASGVTSAISTPVLLNAAARARTAAFFESTQDAFTTRTARFIIQDHFPPGIRNTPGGPLYGVQFSSQLNTDILLPSQTPGISGDPGGVPLFKNGVPVGGLGIAGDFHDVAAREELIPPTQGVLAPGAAFDGYNANPNGLFFRGREEKDFDESVALTGSSGFEAPKFLRASNILIDGLRLPYIRSSAAAGKQKLTFSQLIAGGAHEYSASAPATFSIVPVGSTAIRAGSAEINNTTIAKYPGLIRMRNQFMPSATDPVLPGTTLHTDPQQSDPFVGDDQPGGLTLADVNKIVTNAVKQAEMTRAGIRQPLGVNAAVHIVITNRQGRVLAAFRMQDGTNFSYDVAVQKARTAAFFSDDTHAFSTRAVGFMAQKFFPPGIEYRLRGPLFHLQDALNLGFGTQNPALVGTQIANGITIFPGGAPLYKNGKCVGAIGISGDGVDQDDLIAYGGTEGFRPPDGTRSDQLPSTEVIPFILDRVAAFNAVPGVSYSTAGVEPPLRLGITHLRLPYVKFPRNPFVNHQGRVI